MPGVYSDQFQQLQQKLDRLLVAYDRKANNTSRTPWWQLVLKAVPSIVGTIAAFAFLLQVPSINDSLDRVVQRQFANEQNDALAATRIKGARASSYRQDVGGTVHRPLNVLDNNPDTAWSECGGGQPPHQFTTRIIGRGSACSLGGSGTSAGVGEWIQVDLTSDVALKFVRLRNGYEKDEKLFLRNPRVHKLKLTASNHLSEQVVRGQMLNLADEPGYQTFRLADDDAKCSSIRFTIVSSYAGEEYSQANKSGGFVEFQPYEDTSIADIQLVPEDVSDSGG